MKSYRFIILFILLLITLPFTYGGCFVAFSSGDLSREKEKDDDDSSSGFLGITSQATINSENAGNLTAGAFAGGLTSVESQSSELDQSVTDYQIDVFRALRFPLVLGDSIRKIEISPELIIFSQTNLITENGKFEGSCGGSFSYTLRFNKESENFSGNVSFEEYCNVGITVSGEIDVDGVFQVSSGDIDTATFFFNNLSDGSHTLDGEISIDFSDTPILATFTAYSKDDQSGKIYWLKDYSMNLSELVGHIEIEIFGTFYHPENGFVTLTTSDPFIVHDGDDWPTSGQFAIKGNSGTKARLVALDQLHYGIEADTASEGFFDWDSGILKWNDSQSE